MIIALTGILSSRARVRAGISGIALIAAAVATPTAAVAQTAASDNSAPANSAKKRQVNGQPTAAGAIVVTGQRRALESASDIKKNSDTITDSIVLDEASKVPSTSLLETLERSPGITMNRIRIGDQGSPDGYTFEGSGIQIRGLTGTKTLVNGLEVFSANGGDGLTYSDIGPELLRAVTVYKAGRADLIEGGVAATVDLRTRMPFDSKGTRISGSISGSYGDFSKSITPSASLMASTRFNTGIGEFGVLVDAAYSKIKSYDSSILVYPYYPALHDGSVVYAPAGYYASNDQFERTRKGFYGAIQWRPTPELEFYHTTFISNWNSVRHSQYEAINQTAPSLGVTEDSVFDNGLFVSGGITNSVPANGLTLTSSANFTPSYDKTSDFAQGFKFDSGRWHLSGSYQYVTARAGFSKFGMGLNNAPVVAQANIDTTVGDIPAVGFTTPYVVDPTSTQVSNFNWLTQHNTSSANNWQLDASYDIGDGFLRKLAIGGRIANRKETDNFVGTYWTAAAKGYNGVPKVNISAAPAGDFQLEQFPNFMNGAVQVPAYVYIPSNSILQASQFDYVMNTYAACGPTLMFQCGAPGTSAAKKTVYLYGNPPDLNLGTQPSFSTTRPDSKAVYAMLGFKNESSSPFLNFSGNIGVRWVRYDTQSQGNYVFSNSASSYYLTLADAQASLAQIGGIGNYTAWKNSHPVGTPLPLSYTSVPYSTERAGSFTKDYLLPAFNISFKPSRDWIVRYALTETLTPPNFNDIRAQGSATVATMTNPANNDPAAIKAKVTFPGIFVGYNYTSGNPSLQPETSLNNDLSIEWYPKRGTTVDLELFHKLIKHQILYNSISATASDFFNQADLPMSAPADGSAPQFVDGPLVAKSDINATKNTIIEGAELSGHMYFDMLPGLLRGLGIDANVTYIHDHSPDALALDITGNPVHVPLIGLSKWAYATTLLYDLGKVSARLSWTWRSRYLATTSDSSTSGSYTDPVSKQTVVFGLPLYVAPAGRLSGSIGYEFSKHLSLRFNVENITNVKQRTIMEILPGKYAQRGVFVTDRRFSLLAGFNF